MRNRERGERKGNKEKTAGGQRDSDRELKQTVKDELTNHHHHNNSGTSRTHTHLLPQHSALPKELDEWLVLLLLGSNEVSTGHESSDYRVFQDGLLDLRDNKPGDIVTAAQKKINKGGGG